MSVIVGILYALVVIVALMLIGLILIQPSKSGGTGAVFGGVGESVFGAQAGSHLTKATVILTAVFFILALMLATLVGRGAQKPDDLDRVNSELKKAAAAETAPKAPAEIAPKTAVEGVAAKVEAKAEAAK